MISNTIYRLISFADYSNLGFTKDNVDELTNMFQKEGYVVASFPEFDLQRSIVFQGVSLTSSENKPVIIIGSQRIEIIKGSNKKEGFNEADREILKLEIENCILKIYNAFSSKIQDASRLGWISEYAYFDLSDEKKHNFRKKFLKEMSCFKESSTTEFEVKYAGIENHSFGDMEEKLNVISSIRRWFPGQGEGFGAAVDGFGLVIDVNTLADNKKNRFCGKSFYSFIDMADSIQCKVKEEMLDVDE